MGKKRRALSSNKFRSARAYMWRIGKGRHTISNSEIVEAMQKAEETPTPQAKESEPTIEFKPDPTPAIVEEPTVELKVPEQEQKEENLNLSEEKKPTNKLSRASKTTTKVGKTTARKKRTYTRRKKKTEVSTKDN